MPPPSLFFSTSLHHATELAAADEAVAAPSSPSTLPTLTGATVDLRKRLAVVGAMLGRVEGRIARVKREVGGGSE
jgi:hypothetical protein